MFVQVIQGRVVDADKLRARLDEWVGELSPGAPGWLMSTSGVTGDGRGVALAAFESADAARRNSGRPEQGRWWAGTAELFEGDVTFHDCSQVRPFGRGASADAGFVQIMQGRYTQPEKAQELMRELEGPLREFRPEVIGGAVCLHDDDGGFTQAMYFTSEAEARAGEKRQPPPQVQTLLDEQMELTTDLVFYDLADPWLHTPGR